MEKEKIQYFKEKLISEQSRVLDLIKQLRESEIMNFNSEIASELSFYDNHPSDTASELVEKEKGMALKKNELSIIRKIEDALKSIDNQTYGGCKTCGKEIILERLEFIPYAENCVTCQKNIDNIKPAEQNNRPAEEDALGSPFRYSYGGEVGIDPEDTYMAVERFHRLEDTAWNYEDDDADNGGYVEAIEKISNEQYKNQLPD